MSYGHRLNLEEIFFELAESKFAEATAVQGMVSHRDPETAANASFQGYPTERGLAAVSIAIVAWATSLEAFANLVWNEHLAPTIPAGIVRKMAIKNLSTAEKLKELFGFFSFDLGSATWWSSILKLFEVRNRLIHFKEVKTYQGHSFADPARRMLTENEVRTMRAGAIACIEELGCLSVARTDFTRGDYTFEEIY